MIKADDKDEIIKHLLETLDHVSSSLKGTMMPDETNALRDYIWRRKAEVAF